MYVIWMEYSIDNQPVNPLQICRGLRKGWELTVTVSAVDTTQISTYKQLQRGRGTIR
jgi:hypothetical protein